MMANAPRSQLPDRRREAWAFVALVLLVSCAIYGTHLRGDYLWDDVYLVRDNPLVHAQAGVWALLRTDLWGGATGSPTELYHPLPMITLWAQVQMTGAALVPLRLANVLFHVLATLLFARFVVRTGCSRPVAAIGALAFLVHPLAVEPVEWITGRHDTIAVVAILAGLQLFPLPARGTARHWRAVAVGVAAAAAFLCKEVYVVAPLLFVAADVAICPKEKMDRPSPRARLGSYVIWLGALAPVFAERSHLGIGSASDQVHASVLTNLQHAGTLLASYAGYTLGMSAGPTTRTYSPFALAPALAVVASFAALFASSAWAAWRERASTARPSYAVAALGVFWFVLAIAPLTIALPLIGMYGNRYGYFPSLGLFLALCVVASRVSVHPWFHAASRRRRPAKHAAFAFAGVLLIIGAAASFARASVWHDAVSLYGADVEANPEDAQSLYHLGVAVQRAQGCERATPLFVHASEIAPTMWKAWQNAAGCLINLHQFQPAEYAARHAYELQPGYAGNLYNLTTSLVFQGKLAEAEPLLEEGLRLPKDSARFAQLRHAEDEMKAARPESTPSSPAP